MNARAVNSALFFNPTQGDKVRKPMKITYKPSSIQKDEVRALNKRGFKVVDEKFKPEDYINPDEPETVKSIPAKKTK